MTKQKSWILGVLLATLFGGFALFYVGFYRDKNNKLIHRIGYYLAALVLGLLCLVPFIQILIYPLSFIMVMIQISSLNNINNKRNETVIREENVCDDCHKSNPKDAEHCVHCGEIRQKRCKECDTLIQTDHAFCQKCGTKQTGEKLKPVEEKKSTWHSALLIIILIIALLFATMIGCSFAAIKATEYQSQQKLDTQPDQERSAFDLLNVGKPRHPYVRNITYPDEIYVNENATVTVDLADRGYNDQYTLSTGEDCFYFPYDCGDCIKGSQITVNSTTKNASLTFFPTCTGRKYFSVNLVSSEGESIRFKRIRINIMRRNETE